MPSPRDPSFEAVPNPYGAPDVQRTPASLPPANLELEKMRRTFLRHETIVKAMGLSHYLIGALMVLILVDFGIGFIRHANVGAWLTPRIVILTLTSCGVLGVNLALGYGLRSLQSWARWAETMMLALGAIGSIVATAWAAMTGDNVGLLVCGLLLVGIRYGLHVLLGTRGAVVFSGGYRELVQRTPGLHSEGGWLAKLWVIVLVSLGVLLVIGYVAFRHEL